MKTNKDSSRPEQLRQPIDQPRKKPYRAPTVTVLQPDEAKARLAKMAVAGDCDAGELLKLVS